MLNMAAKFFAAKGDLPFLRHGRHVGRGAAGWQNSGQRPASMARYPPPIGHVLWYRHPNMLWHVFLAEMHDTPIDPSGWRRGKCEGCLLNDLNVVRSAVVNLSRWRRILNRRWSPSVAALGVAAPLQAGIAPSVNFVYSVKVVRAFAPPSFCQGSPCRKCFAGFVKITSVAVVTKSIFDRPT